MKLSLTCFAAAQAYPTPLIASQQLEELVDYFKFSIENYYSLNLDTCEEAIESGIDAVS